MMQMLYNWMNFESHCIISCHHQSCWGPGIFDLGSYGVLQLESDPIWPQAPLLRAVLCCWGSTMLGRKSVVGVKVVGSSILTVTRAEEEE